MEKSIITTGKSIDLAIAAALQQLGLDRDSVSVEVLENAKTGFLGIGACPAKVKVTYEIPDPVVEPAPALSAASRKPKKQAPKLEKPLPMPEPVKPEAKAEPKSEPKKAEPKKDQPKKQNQNKPARSRADKPAPKLQPQREYTPAEPGSQEERVETFLKGLLERMDSDAVPHAFRKDDETIGVELVGEDLGMLIGRRGETLDAIQHLANYALNHDASKRTRVSVDAENYRGKREDSLRHLAKKMAAKVIKYRKNMTLEPMNAYERHVIHATLQDMPEVTTFSTGTEPNRRVVISYVKE